MTLDRLTTDLALTGVPWDKPRWERFVRDLTPEEQALEVQMLADSAEPPTTSAWQDALRIMVAVLGALPTVAADLVGLGSAVTAIEAAIRG